MAITDPWRIPIDINSCEYAIKGNMIKAQLVVSDLEQLQMNVATFQDDIKQRLLMVLLDELMKTKSVEFTKMPHHSHGLTYFRARMFAVPDDQVRILRVS
jgi:hypothetical protein